MALKNGLNPNPPKRKYCLAASIFLFMCLVLAPELYGKSQELSEVIPKQFKLDLIYSFVIFFVTLGPLKTIPIFVKVSKKLDSKQKSQLALRGVLNSAIIIGIITTIFSFIAQGWNLSPESLMIAGGILLFISASQAILNFQISKEHHITPDPGTAKSEEVPNNIKGLALTPISIPAIITPIGVLAILYFILMSHHTHQFIEVLGLLGLIIVLNLVCMLFAERIMNFIGLAVFQVIAWIFGILQSVLAIQFLYEAMLRIHNTLN